MGSAYFNKEEGLFDLLRVVGDENEILGKATRPNSM
jgi:hypothetical protein